MDDIEDVERYVPGGYHPIDIGDESISSADDGIHSYTVLHKLGHGGFSTVWLVRSRQNMLYFALKVLCADESGMGECNELKALEYLQRGESDGGGDQYHPCIVKLHGSFEIVGPNGRHVCLVFPVLGPSLGDLGVLKSLSPATRYRVCQQVASGVAFLHERGLCHNDLTPSNIAFEFPDTFFFTPAQVCHLLGPIKTERLKLPDGTHSPHAPQRVVQAPDFSGLNLPQALRNIQIIDLGEAFFSFSTSDNGHRCPPSSLGIPMSFFPPELCFGRAPSAKSDVWELGCVMFEIFSKQRLFQTFFPIYEMLIGTIMPIVGPLPAEWKTCFDSERYGYREGDGRRLQSDVAPDWWFETRLHTETLRGRLEKAAATHLSAALREAVVSILESALVYEPERRVSSMEVEARLRSISSMFGSGKRAGKV